jgi:ribonuclease R
MSSNKSNDKHQMLEKKILKLLSETPQYLPDIFREFNARKKKDYKFIQKVVKKLENKRFIVSDRRGLFKTTVNQQTIKGKISVSPQGYGFVEPANAIDELDIFIPAKYINGALDGDIVVIKIIQDDFHRKKKPGMGPVGLVDEIIERKRPFLIGELRVKRDGFYIRALNRKIPDDLPLAETEEKLKKGDWLKVEVVYSEENGTFCKFIKRIGRVGNTEDDIDAIVAEYNLHSPYTHEEEKLADEIVPVDIDRKDLTSFFCVTIDPHDAKDFDDAVSVQQGLNKNEVILGVHIADVAAWIKPGSWIDKEAKARGFTAYIPGRTLPMLPKNLTKHISLRSDKDNCLAHSVLLTVDKTSGQIKHYERCRSKIRIGKRLTFKEVEKYIQSGDASEDWNDELKSNLNTLCELYSIMRGYRENFEKFLDIETTEIRILRNDSDGKILGLEKKKQGKADCLVEEFMLAANSAVAKEFVDSQIPGIFRIHPEPDSEKLEDFSGFVSQVFSIQTGDLSLSRKECQNFLKQIKGDKSEQIIIAFFLRAMNRALYSDKSALHYGLGKGLYLHFTSPIRRYPDLLVHQQLLLKQQQKTLLTQGFITEIAESCTDLEKNNDEAYYAANDRLKLHYLQELLSKNENESYEAVISKVNAGGMLADIPSIGLSAFVPIESISGTYNKRYGRLVSERGGQEYKPGDFVYLLLEKIDFIKGSAIFRPVQY